MSITRFAGVGLLRACLVFSVLAVLGAAAFIIIDRDNPLESDDPYIVGSIFGCVGACLAIVYTVAEAFKKDGCAKDLIYAVALGSWCLLLWAASRGGGEGAGILAFFSFGSLVAGVLGWPLCRFRLPNKISAAVCLAGILFVAMRIFVSVKLFGVPW